MGISRKVCFGRYEFCPATSEISKDGRPLRIDPQAAGLLSLLLEAPGKLVSYEAIRTRLWPGTFVDYESGIRRCVAQLRNVLRDNAKNPVYIETERGRGCRFIAPVWDSAEPEPVEPAEAAFQFPGGDFPSGGLERRLRSWILILAATVLVVLLGAALLTAAYGLAIVAFCLGAIFIFLSYGRLSHTRGVRAGIAAYLIAGMSYTASASTMPAFDADVVNAATLPPAVAYLFVIGLKFIPLLALVLSYSVVVDYVHPSGHSDPIWQKVYTPMGILFLFVEVICLCATSGYEKIWKARLPGEWILGVGASAILVLNLAVWLSARPCIFAGSKPKLAALFSVCAIAYAGIAVAAFFVDDEHNRIDRYYLDVRWPEAYVAENPNAVGDLYGLSSRVQSEVGPDLAALFKDPDFISALHHQTFYKVHADEPFQLFDRAVIYAYRPKSQPPGPSAFVSIRFPKELADALRFEPVGEK